MLDWTDKRYWLLGADTDLGKAIACKLNRAGIHVVLSGKNQDALENLMVSLPGRASYIPLDLSCPETLDAVAIELGPVDGMVFAMDTRMTSGFAGPLEASSKMISDNLLGLACALDVVLSRMRDHGGHLVMIDSLAGYLGLPGQAGYAASKAGVRMIAEALRAEASDGRIAVQLVTLVQPERDPDAAAAGVFEHMGTPRFRRTVPVLGGLAVLAARYLPGWLMRPTIATLTKQAQN